MDLYSRYPYISEDIRHTTDISFFRISAKEKELIRARSFYLEKDIFDTAVSETSASNLFLHQDNLRNR